MAKGITKKIICGNWKMNPTSQVEAKKIFETFDPSVMCKHHCTYDFRNKVIKDAIDCYGSDINFI